MNGKQVIDRVRAILNDQDSSGFRWTDSELVMWLNDACRYVAMARPDSSSVNGTLTLAAGSKQNLITAGASIGARLLDIYRNTTSGRAIRLIDREALDSQNVTWHSDTQSSTIYNFIFDNRDPRTFFVYPPATAATQVDGVWSVSPTEVTTANFASTALAIEDIYMDVLVNYILFRAYGKDQEASHNAELAKLYRDAVDSAIGSKTQIDSRFSPDLNSPDGNPSLGTKTGGV